MIVFVKLPLIFKEYKTEEMMEIGKFVGNNMSLAM